MSTPMRSAMRPLVRPVMQAPMRAPTRALALALAIAAGPAAAELKGVAAGHFESTHRAEVSATPARVYEVFAQLPTWWDPRHSWSGDARHMTLEAREGGCWCERWGDSASVQHARVLQAIPGRGIVMDAALGPLLSLPARGVFLLALGRSGDKTVLRMSYRVSGAPELALDQLAPAVDRVLAEQFARLTSMVETGKP